MNSNQRIIILDISANTHKNDKATFKRIIDEVVKRDLHNRVVFKGQLWQGIKGDNLRQDTDLFAWMTHYTLGEHNRELTASVFDKQSLFFLLALWRSMKKTFKVQIPFVKIANNRDLDYLADYIPRGTMIARSLSGKNWLAPRSYIPNCVDMFCVSKYPATMDDYLCDIRISKHMSVPMTYAISDHTPGLDLYKMLKPWVWEKHVKLANSTGLDAGPFSITPEELEEVLI